MLQNTIEKKKAILCLNKIVETQISRSKSLEIRPGCIRAR